VLGAELPWGERRHRPQEIAGAKARRPPGQGRELPRMVHDSAYGNSLPSVLSVATGTIGSRRCQVVCAPGRGAPEPPTRLVRFGRPKGSTRPGRFDLLGFTHFWKLSRNGKWVIARKTAKGRLARGLHRITQWCKVNRHLPVEDQHKVLLRRLTGHFAYHGITVSGLWLNRPRNGEMRAWRTWLRRRFQKTRLTWERYNRLLKRSPLPSARVVHSIYRQAANP
jgi:hypothetical protein